MMELLMLYALCLVGFMVVLKRLNDIEGKITRKQKEGEGTQPNQGQEPT